MILRDMSTSFSLRDRTALVTGGASGIGFGIVTALLERGAKVVIADIRTDHMEEAAAALGSYTGRFFVQHLDVADPHAWTRARDEVMARFGTLDVLCLNAGIGILAELLQARPNDWAWVVGVNLRGVTLGVETFLPILRGNANGGRLYATSSMGGLLVGGNDGLYACAKFGVTALMECLRLELAAENIGVTTLFPAAVNTNIHDHAGMRPQALADTGLVSDPQQQRAMAEMAREVLAKGADPLDVGERVVNALIANEPHVFTDSLVAPLLRKRYGALMAVAHKRRVRNGQHELDACW